MSAATSTTSRAGSDCSRCSSRLATWPPVGVSTAEVTRERDVVKHATSEEKPHESHRDPEREAADASGRRTELLARWKRGNHEASHPADPCGWCAYGNRCRSGVWRRRAAGEHVPR